MPNKLVSYVLVVFVVPALVMGAAAACVLMGVLPATWREDLEFWLFLGVGGVVLVLTGHGLFESVLAFGWWRAPLPLRPLLWHVAGTLSGLVLGLLAYALGPALYSLEIVSEHARHLDMPVSEFRACTGISFLWLGQAIVSWNYHDFKRGENTHEERLP